MFETEKEESDLMQRPPRAASQRLFDSRMVRTSLLQGFGLLAIVLVIFGVAFRRGQGADDARALTFTALVIANFALVVANRSRSRNLLGVLKTPNRAMWMVLGGALVLLGLVLYLAPLRAIFHFSQLHLNDIALCIGAGVVSLFWLEVVKPPSRMG